MVTIINTNEYIYCGSTPTDNKYYAKVYYKDGTSYQGYFLNKLKNGYGEQKDKGSYYKGYWKDDKYHGSGIFFNSKDMSYMTGYYQDGLLEGECLFYDKNMVMVNKALFKNGKSCVPTYEITYDDKKIKKYEGFMFNGKYNGFGKLYDNNRVYIGNFISDKKDGKFLICNKDGSLVYSPETNIEIIIDIDKVKPDNFINYKNTVIFTNDYLDDNHKLVYKEKQIIKYIGKFNMDMQFHDDNATYFENGNKFTGKFENGKFISGVLYTKEGEFKGEFNNLLINGSGSLLNTSFGYTGTFVNNVSKEGTLVFKYNGTSNARLNCNATYNTEHFVFEPTKPTTLRIEHSPNNIEQYVGTIKMNIGLASKDIKINIINAQYYQGDTLVYEGDFRLNKYHGSGIRYHPNGKIQASGKFNEGDTFKCEYFDDDGNLIYSDEGAYTEDNHHIVEEEIHDLPPLVSLNQLEQMNNNIIQNDNINNMIQNNNIIQNNNAINQQIIHADDIENNEGNESDEIDNID
jgi:hypothetical protein